MKHTSMSAKTPAKKTKIVCTIGPASQELSTLTKLVESGMDIARINFAHGSLDTHKLVIQRIRQASQDTGIKVAILGDLPGPKIRIGKLEQETMELLRGGFIILQTKEILGTESRISVSLPQLPHVVAKGDIIFLNDGYIQLEVIKVVDTEVHCTVLVGGELRAHKGVNFPGIDLGINAFTEQDAKYLAIAASENLDAVSQSFVQDADDILAVRKAALALDYNPFIVAKIERSRAIENIDSILDVADGIMVARGDLGVETPFEQIAYIQKQTIAKANAKGKPVITATHMLESMITHRRPTRAEGTDVANAILDGTDCLMLSGETSVGDYPVESVEAMVAIASFTESKKEIAQTEVAQHVNIGDLRNQARSVSLHEQISLSTKLAVSALEPDLVVVKTRSGDSVRRLTKYRIPVWIVAISNDDATCQRLCFSYGVYAVYTPSIQANLRLQVVEWIKQNRPDTRLTLLTEEIDTCKTRDTALLEVINLA